MAKSKKQAQALTIKLSRERRAGKKHLRHRKTDMARRLGRERAEILWPDESAQSLRSIVARNRGFVQALAGGPH
jgi:hypothetical protein